MAATLTELLADPPRVHGPAGAPGVTTHALLGEVLEHLERTVEPSHRTLETGCGLSTIVFAMRGCEHTCVVQEAAEVERVQQWCEAHAVDHSRVRFCVARSEQFLPGADLGALDLVLIDGSHSFPIVFTDWLYTRDALKVGGALVVDDVDLWTGRVLRDFLAAEPGWELTRSFRGQAAAFRKVAPVDPWRMWVEQPYVRRRSRRVALRRLRAGIDRVRSR